jgi:O-antigen biosynthesis rhamnosyltransferase
MGGVEQFIFQLARSGHAHGIENKVLSLSHSKDDKVIQMSGHQAYRAKTIFEIASTPFSFAVFKKFALMAKEADVIHYQFPFPFMDVVHFATQHKKPTVVSYQSDIVRQKRLYKFYAPLQNKFLASVDCIVTTSNSYLASSKVLQRYSDKVKVIPIGLDQASYPEPTGQKINYWKSRFKKRFFLFVGMLRYYKGLHILMEAAQGAHYPIVIIGSGPSQIALKAQATKLGLTNVHFLGLMPDEDKAALLNLCYAVLLPSHLRSEAFGISLLEGAMFGKPMISSEIGTGTTFINIVNETGLTVTPGDPVALREAMDYLWEHPEQAAEMGRNAELRYRKYFTARDMASAYAKLYQELVRK